MRNLSVNKLQLTSIETILINVKGQYYVFNISAQITNQFSGCGLLHSVLSKQEWSKIVSTRCQNVELPNLFYYGGVKNIPNHCILFLQRSYCPLPFCLDLISCRIRLDTWNTITRIKLNYHKHPLAEEVVLYRLNHVLITRIDWLWIVGLWMFINKHWEEIKRNQETDEITIYFGSSESPMTRPHKMVVLPSKRHFEWPKQVIIARAVIMLVGNITQLKIYE